MNHREIRIEDFFRTVSFVGSKMAFLAATLVFWLLLFALISSPAWLPGLVDQFISK